MKRNVLFRLALVAMTVGAMENAHAGSAVAFSRATNGLVVDAGVPVELAKQHALAEARRKYGAGVQIIGATDVSGYGAVAVARHPNGVGWIICYSMGRTSAAEAENLAKQKCRQLGGQNPQVKLRFQG
jgi:hypothetical protein